MTRRRRGYTLTELLIATALVAIVLAVVFRMLVSASRLFTSGVAAARGPEAAILLMDRLEEDLLQVVQIPGDPRPPVWISDDGARLCYYRADPARTDPATLVGVPATWALTSTLAGDTHPARDGEVLPEIDLAGLEFELLAPSLEAERPAWLLRFTARFPGDGLAGREHVATRLVHLAQPSSNFLHFLTFGDEVPAGAVALLPPPEDDPGFDALGPPDGADHPHEEDPR